MMQLTFVLVHDTFYTVPDSPYIVLLSFWQHLTLLNGTCDQTCWLAEACKMLLLLLTAHLTSLTMLCSGSK